MKTRTERTRTVSRRAFLSMSAGAAVALGGPASGRVRVGIIGLGRRGGLQVWGFSRTPNVDVCGLCDVQPPKLHRFASLLAAKSRAIPDSHSDWRQLLDRKDIDAVAIAVPAKLRKTVVLEAIRAGKHVLLDPNPLLGLEEGSILAQEAKSARLLVDVPLDYTNTAELMACSGLAGGNYRAITTRALVSGADRSLIAQPLGVLHFARRLLNVSLPFRVTALDLSDISSVASFTFRATSGEESVLYWQVCRVRSVRPSRDSVELVADDARSFEWMPTAESDSLFRPQRGLFHSFAQAVRKDEAGLLANPLQEAMITSTIAHLAIRASQCGRPVSFDPIRQRLVGMDKNLQADLT